SGRRLPKPAVHVPARSLRSLDTILVETVDYWKKFLSSEIHCRRKNEVISVLLNSVIFARAVEDHYELRYGVPGQTLLNRWQNTTTRRTKLRHVIARSLKDYHAATGASKLLSLDKLTAFDTLDDSTVEGLIESFYKVKNTPYTYNFALMSRHALSRIYEKYVALLRQEASAEGRQKTLFPIGLPEAERNKAAGAIYTPQFVARFFARFVERNTVPQAFRQMKVADPACGSGIFLRAFVERQVARDDLTSAAVKSTFKRLTGIDIDASACDAARLSLAVLHLMLTDELPKALDVRADDAIHVLLSDESVTEAYGAVVGNPPFVRLESQSPALQERVRGFLSDIARGRPDLYLAILRIAMRMVGPGGFLAMVLPHRFLIGKTPAGLRNELTSQFWLRCVVDLSAIRVFHDFSTYVILLIAQKKQGDDERPPSCRVVRCQDYVGQALQDCSESKTVRTPYYSVFDVEQECFGDGPWIVLGPEEGALERRLQAMPKLKDFLVVREGLITGADRVYILAKESVPKAESDLYAPLLPDREMDRYTVPRRTDSYVYYPYRVGQRIGEPELRQATRTWQYLVDRREALGKSATACWPYLVRGRERELLQPKIVCPNLMLVPRFALDQEGKYVVTRAPFLIPRQRRADTDLLMFFTGVLNSSVAHWYLTTHAHRFSRGYVKVEPATLKNFGVPDPARIPSGDFARIVELVKKRIESRDRRVEGEIDTMVLQAYGLTAAERQVIGAELQ
ncbi:MAG: N-6 DNA methylase, partial [Candidatus Brocadiae bacterium]|nr:N-6 DNA methylase [Candidatus Brocadiia bacterium]